MKIKEAVGKLFRRQVVLAFWARVDICGATECWNWVGWIDRPATKHRNFRFNGESIGVHRFALSLKLGRLLDPAEWALHTCDNGACCNPRHLYVGDDQDNARDRNVRGRTSCGRKHSQKITTALNGRTQGEKNHASKLTREERM